MPSSSSSLESFDVDFYADSIVEHFAGQRITHKDLKKWVKLKWPEIKWQKKLTLVMEVLVNNQRATKRELSISPRTPWYGFITPGQAFAELTKYHVSKEYSDSLDPKTSIGKVYAAREKLYELKALHSKEILENATKGTKFEKALLDFYEAVIAENSISMQYLQLLKNELDMAYSVSTREVIISRRDIHMQRGLEILKRLAPLKKMEVNLNKHNQSTQPLLRQALNLSELARWEKNIVKVYETRWQNSVPINPAGAPITSRTKEGLENYELELDITFDEDKIINQVDSAYNQFSKLHEDTKKLYQSLNSTLTGAKNRQVGQLRSMANNQELLNL